MFSIISVTYSYKICSLGGNGRRGRLKISSLKKSCWFNSSSEYYNLIER